MSTNGLYLAEPARESELDRRDEEFARRPRAQKIAPRTAATAGACARAPISMVNHGHWHERVRPEGAGRLVDDIRTKGAAALNGCHLKLEK